MCARFLRFANYDGRRPLHRPPVLFTINILNYNIMNNYDYCLYCAVYGCTPLFNSLVTTTAVHSRRADYILYLTRLREDILNLVRASGKFGFMGWKTRNVDWSSFVSFFFRQIRIGLLLIIFLSRKQVIFTFLFPSRSFHNGKTFKYYIILSRYPTAPVSHYSL